MSCEACVTRGPSCIRRCGAVVRFLAATAALCAAAGGCKSTGESRTPGRPHGRYLESSRNELLATVLAQADMLRTLKARAEFRVLDSGRLVPRDMEEEEKRRKGKPFKVWPMRVSLTGYLIAARPSKGSTNVKVYADVPTVAFKLYMLGLGKEFWMLIPGKSGIRAKGVMVRGFLDRTRPRSLRFPTPRPQDIANLLFYGYLRREEGHLLSMMETYEDEYVITTLCLDRPEKIESRIWVDRRDLQVSTHQLFDADGTLIVEARLLNYKQFCERPPHVTLPTTIVLIWPKERMVLNVALRDIKVNADIKPELFKPLDPSQYEQMIMAQPASSFKPEFPPPPEAVPLRAPPKPRKRRKQPPFADPGFLPHTDLAPPTASYLPGGAPAAPEKKPWYKFW